MDCGRKRAGGVHAGGKNPRFAPVMINLKDDGGKKAGFAHVNPMSYADSHLRMTGKHFPYLNRRVTPADSANSGICFHLLSNTLNLFWEHRKR